MLNMPMLSQSSYDAFFDRTSTSTTNRDTHAVMAAQAVQLVHIVRGISRAVLDLSSRRIQLNSTRGTVEVISMINFAPETQWRIVDYAMALIADMLAQAHLLLLPVAVVAEGTILVANKTRVRQRDVATLAREALRMPVGHHCFDYTADDKIIALVAAWREQDVEIFLAILAPLKLVEDAVLELAEALGAYKTLGMPQLPI